MNPAHRLRQPRHRPRDGHADDLVRAVSGRGLRMGTGSGRLGRVASGPLRAVLAALSCLSAAGAADPAGTALAGAGSPLGGMAGEQADAPLSAASLGQDGELGAPSTGVPDPDPAAPPLTLDEALARAHALNETTVVAQARLEAALALRRQAAALLLPTLNATAGASWSRYHGDPLGSYPAHSRSVGVGFTCTLFNPASIEGVRAAESGVAAQRLASEDLRRQLAFQVATAFITVIGDERIYRAAVQRRDAAAQTLSDTRQRVRAGVAAANDATRSALELTSAQLALINDRQAVLATPVVQPLREPPLAVLPARDLHRLELAAQDERPDLRSDQLRIRASDQQGRAALDGYLPSIGLEGGWSAANQVPTPFVPYTPDWSAGVVLNWTLVDGGYRLGVAEQYAAISREQRADLVNAYRDLHRDLVNALGDLAAAEAAVAEATQAIGVAQLNFSEVTARFRQGLATALDQADANASLFEADSGLTTSRVTLASTRFQLRQLLGRWPTSDGPPSEPALPPHAACSILDPRP
jgi:outer membrane protein TolC